MVTARLEEALARGGIVQRMAVRGVRPAGFGRGDDIVRDFWDAYGKDRVQETPILPTAREISRADEAIGWLLWLDEPAKRLVCGRLRGTKWRRLEAIFYVTERTLHTRFKLAILSIVGRLNIESSRLK